MPGGNESDAEEFAQAAAVQPKEALFHRYRFQPGGRGPVVRMVLCEDRRHQTRLARQDQRKGRASQTEGERTAGGARQAQEIEPGIRSVDRMDGTAVFLAGCPGRASALADAGGSKPEAGHGGSGKRRLD